jgi:hypothetical protein
MDWCGNLCDADYDQDGTTGFLDFGQFTGAFATTDLEKDHTKPVTGPPGFIDFGFFTGRFGDGGAGPSGFSPGTTACN